MYKIWSENLKGRSHSEDRRRREDNIRMDLREICWEGVEWIHLDQDRYQWQTLVNTVMNLWVPYKAGNFLIITHVQWIRSGKNADNIDLHVVWSLCTQYMTARIMNTLQNLLIISFQMSTELCERRDTRTAPCSGSPTPCSCSLRARCESGARRTVLLLWQQGKNK